MTACPEVAIARDSFVHRQPSSEVLAMTGHYEERVIDADSDADHRRQDRSERGHLGHATEEVDEQHSDAESDQGCEHRQRHSYDRPERNGEDQHGHAETDQLRGPGLLGSEAFDNWTAVGDVEARSEGGSICGRER